MKILYRREPVAIPRDSLIFGYGPMAPFALGALGCWLVSSLREVAVALTIIWGGLILAFVGGVRRGFGFGRPEASTRIEIVTMMVYVSLAGAALIGGWMGMRGWAVGLLAGGFTLVPMLDSMAARDGDAPEHFARLRPPQMGIAVVSLLAILLRLMAD